MRVFYASVLSVALLGLAGCNSSTDTDADPVQEEPAQEDAPDPQDDDTAQDPSPTTSILRPDIEQPEIATANPDAPVVFLEPLEMTIGFAQGGASLDDAAKAALDDALASAQMAEDGPIVLRGHSDSGGSDAANMRASRNRAQSVRDYLVENGVASDRIEIIAFGEQNPVAPNALPDGSPNEAGRERNRRVELVVGAQEEAEDPGEGEQAEQA